MLSFAAASLRISRRMVDPLGVDCGIVAAGVLGHDLSCLQCVGLVIGEIVGGFVGDPVQRQAGAVFLPVVAIGHAHNGAACGLGCDGAAAHGVYLVGFIVAGCNP